MRFLRPEAIRVACATKINQCGLVHVGLGIVQHKTFYTFKVQSILTAYGANHKSEICCNKVDLILLCIQREVKAKQKTHIIS